MVANAVLQAVHEPQADAVPGARLEEVQQRAPGRGRCQGSRRGPRRVHVAAHDGVHDRDERQEGEPLGEGEGGNQHEERQEADAPAGDVHEVDECAGHAAPPLT